MATKRKSKVRPRRTPAQLAKLAQAFPPSATCGNYGALAWGRALKRAAAALQRLGSEHQEFLTQLAAELDLTEKCTPPSERPILRPLIMRIRGLVNKNEIRTAQTLNELMEPADG